MLARAFFDPPRMPATAAIQQLTGPAKTGLLAPAVPMNSPNTTVEDLRHERRLRPEPASRLRAPAVGSGEVADTRLWLIRHAEVKARYPGVFGGQVDMDLSPRGHEQAAALARYLRSRTVNAIYASPMKRVQQTLQPWVVNGVPRPTIVPELREVDFGAWTGLTFGQVQDRYVASAPGNGFGSWRVRQSLTANVRRRSARG